MHDRLRADLDQLIKGLSDYADVISSSSEDYPMVADARDRLRTCLRGFVQTSVEVTGWGNPLVQLHLDVPDSNQPDMVVSRACGRLVQALREHALAIGEAGDDPVLVMPTINEVRSSALAYVEAVNEVSGWGNVFADLYDDPAAP
jgi:hypothetical protein